MNMRKLSGILRYTQNFHYIYMETPNLSICNTNKSDVIVKMEYVLWSDGESNFPIALNIL